MTVAIRFRLLFTCHRRLCLNRRCVHKQVFVSVFESLALHAVHLSAEVDAVGAGLFVFHFQNLRKNQTRGIVAQKTLPWFSFWKITKF